MNLLRWTGLIFLGLLLAGPLQAQHSWQVLPWKSHATLYDYLTDQLHARYVKRTEELDRALKDGRLASYQDSVRIRYRKILGALPARTPLHAQVFGRRSEDGFVLSHVLFESWPQHHVTADLYEPASGKGPWPGVLFFCGHEMSSKATLTYQKTAMLFARNGFIVLEIDPISQGERLQLTDAHGRNLTRGATTGHTLLDAGSNLIGTSVAAYQLWDNERALDFLSSLPEVDTSRLGCLGNSGGGTQTAYFMAYDPRIKVAAPCSYVTRRERSIELLGPQDGCQWLCSEGKEGLDISDFLVAFAPKPVLILAGRYDFVDYNGVLDVDRELQGVYRNLGAPDRLRLLATDSGHGIQKPKRETALQWFRRWLYGDSTFIPEGDLNSLSAAALQVSPTGQVNTSYPHESDVQDRNLRIGEARLRQARRHLNLAVAARYLKSALCDSGSPLRVDTQQMETRLWMGHRLQAIILRRQGQPPLPLWLYLPAHPNGSTLLLSGSGKQAVLQDSSLMQAMFSRHRALILADLRGMGETADPAAFNDKKYVNREYRTAMLSLFLGEPLPLQRLQDIRSLVTLVSMLPPAVRRPLNLRASGACAQAALLAAVLQPGLRSLSLNREGPGLLEMLRNPLTADQYTYVIPGVLSYFDMNDIRKMLGHRIHKSVKHPLP